MKENISSKEGLPFVSVIVPVYNGIDCISANIESLLDQDYPKDKYEILVIDNGSSDGTKEIIKKYPVIFLQENNIKNSYIARNKGIEYAKGEILAFIDVDCMASLTWISDGVDYMLQHKADIVGGCIEFSFSENPTSSELLDSLINLDNESVVRLRHTAQTANVFIKMKLFKEIGLFPTKQASGGDAMWTHNAWREGCSVLYSSNAVVIHSARELRELLSKHVRVGTGCLAVWRNRDQNIFWIVARFCSLLLPVLAFKLPRLIEKRGRKDVYYPLFKMMLISYLCNLMTAWGIVKSLFKIQIS